MELSPQARRSTEMALEMIGRDPENQSEHPSSEHYVEGQSALLNNKKFKRNSCVSFELPTFVGFANIWLAILYWAITATIVIVAWVYYRKLQTQDFSEAYGLSRLYSSTCSSFSYTSTTLGSILIGANAVTSLVMLASDSFRTEVVAPKPKLFCQGGIVPGVASLSGFFAASYLRRTLFIILVLTSVPLYFLSGSLVFVQYPAANVYQILASTSYFEGAAYNTSALQMSQWPRDESATLPSSKAIWPQAYVGVSELDLKLEKLRQTASTWTNLSRYDCTAAYNQVEYTQYKTLVMVTNYTTPNFNNSLLAIGVLPGYRISSRDASLLSLCPKAYLDSYTAVKLPDSAPFLENFAPDEALSNVHYVDPKDAIANATRDPNGITHNIFQMPLGCSDSPSTPCVPSGLPGYEVPDILGHSDLCYNYWNGRWNGSGKDAQYFRPRCTFLYCLAEPLEEERTCEALLDMRILLAVAIILTIKLAAMTVALYLRCFNVVITSWREGLDYDPSVRDRMRGVNARAEYRPGLFWHSNRIKFVYLLMLGWGIWLYFAVNNTNLQNHPGTESDTTWFYSILVVFKMLHIFHNILTYVQSLAIDRKAANVDFKDYIPREKGFLPAVLNVHKNFKTWLTPAMAGRNFLLHLTINWIYVVSFLEVQVLEEGVQAMPIAHARLGIWDSINAARWPYAWPYNATLSGILYGLIYVAALQIAPVAMYGIAWYLARAPYTYFTRNDRRQ